jgi:hypothetical protein
MIATELTYEDLECLRDVLVELHLAGRTKEVESLHRIHGAIEYIIAEAAGLDMGTGEDDPEFVAAMEQAERDYAEGRWLRHEDVMRRLRALDDE